MGSWLWVMVGGALGAGARYGLGLLGAGLDSRSGFPVTTLLINVSGSFALGVTLALVDRGLWPEAARLAVGSGLLGGFTTFSAFSAGLGDLLASPVRAAGYAGLSVGLGLAGALLGRAWGGRL
ncbi:fluoride efflux transporter FluC [Deinococcus aquaedulcis]|uniref:fluoride efflux transporter FluC n=1 Tax=Deinococcus aquaedulcis TaxID=2840455 RepID=UPI001C833D62|nr:CrcB family protein [Deinococcus aquaedulcis]